MAASPPISKAPKRGFGKREQKPGAATSRPGPSNVPRTLQRALSTEQQNRRSVSRGPGNKIALMRSATSTSLSGIKKEASESVVLSAVPQAEPDAPRSVSSQTQSNRSTTTPPMADAKADKRAQLASELKAAISALRKPNREVVSKAMAEAAERRATTPSSTKSELILRPSELAVRVLIPSWQRGEKASTQRLGFTCAGQGDSDEKPLPDRVACTWCDTRLHRFLEH